MGAVDVAPEETPTGPPEAAVNVDWMLANFVARTPGVTEAVAVSSDGFLLATSAAGTQAEGTEQFAAIIAGLTSLTRGAAELYSYGNVTQVIVEMDFGNLFVMAVDTGSTVGVLADDDTDIGALGYEMALLIDRVGALLTPALIDELKNSIALRVQGH